MNQIKINNESDSFKKIIYYSANYCYGRKTYMPGIFMEFVKENISIMDIEIMKLITNEIEDRNYKEYLGSYFDKKDWLDFRNYLMENIHLIKKNNDNTLIINDIKEDYGLIVASAVRYAFGKSIEIIQIIDNYLIDNYQSLDNHTYGILERDLYSYIYGKDQFFYGRMEENQEKIWISIYKIIFKEFNKRGIKPWQR